MFHNVTSLERFNVVWVNPHHIEREVRVMNNVDDLSCEQMSELFDYDVNTGDFIWNISPAKNVRRGSLAGQVKETRATPSGEPARYRYLRFTVDGKKYETVASRVAWLFIHGHWPLERVRMKDGNTLNLREDNLYLATTVVGGDNSNRLNEGSGAYHRAWRKQNPLAAKDSELRGAFGIGLAEYGEMLVAQGGVCAICLKFEKEERNEKKKALAVDHCHDTGKIRGLLCSACNTGIGKFGDNPDVLRAAADYLDRHQKKEAA